MKNPGWVDLQVNGHNGVDFSNPLLTEDMVIKAAEELFAAGTEIFLPTIITGPMELYRRNIPIIRKAVESHGLLDRIPGVHLEGPFISNTPGAVGAHNPDGVQIPSAAAVCRKPGSRSAGFASSGRACSAMSTMRRRSTPSTRTGAPSV